MLLFKACFICFYFLAELFPVDVRVLMSGVSNCIANLYIFTVVKTFPSLAR